MGKAGTLSKRSVRHVRTDGALTWPARPPQADRTPPANADGGAWCGLQLCPRGDTDHVTATAQGPGLKPLPLRLTHDTECGRAHAPRGQEASAVCPLHRWVHITCPWGISRGTHVHAAAGRAGQAAGT